MTRITAETGDVDFEDRWDFFRLPLAESSSVNHALPQMDALGSRASGEIKIVFPRSIANARAVLFAACDKICVQGHEYQDPWRLIKIRNGGTIEHFAVLVGMLRRIRRGLRRSARTHTPH